MVRAGEGYAITFAATRACAVAVSVEGPNGRTVRHLAAGLLGENAPAPLERGTLAQRLLWDGKDDQGRGGRPAPAGSRVRVVLGVRPTFAGLVELEPPGVFSRGVVGLAIDGAGTLWLMQGKAWERQVGTPEVVAFRRNGSYLKTIVPFRADLAPRQLPQVKFVEGPGGLVPESPYENFLPGLQGIGRQTMVLSGGRLVVVSGMRAPLEGAPRGTGRRLLRIGLDGSTDDGYFGPALPDDGYWGKRFFLTATPDGRTFYLAGLRSHVKQGLSHQVYRAAWSDAKFAPLAGEWGVPGADEAHFNDPRGLAVDAQGRLLVCDFLNDRIQVLSPEGRLVRSLAVTGPEQVLVHPRTGALYVLSVADRGEQLTALGVTWEAFERKALVKFRSADDFTETARLDLPRRPLYLHDPGPLVALDAGAEVPVLWVSCVGRQEPRDYLWRIEDRSDALVQTPTPMDRYYCPFGVGAAALAVDRATGDVYFAGRTTPTVLKIDAATGAVTSLDKVAAYLYDGDTRPFKKQQVTALGVDGEGRLLARLMGTWSGMANALVRVRPDGTPAPFDASGKAIALTQPSHGYHSGGFAVAANGDIHVIELVAGGKHRDRSEHNVLNVYGPDGGLKRSQAIPHLTSGAWGPRFDRLGRMLLTESIRPVGCGEGEHVGSLLAFESAAGGLVFGEGVTEAPYEMRLHEAEIVPVRLTGLRWLHFGVSPAPFGHCVCPSAQFDIDGFDRVVVTDAVNHRLKLLDSAGNLLAVMGTFANRDSRGPVPAPVREPLPGATAQAGLRGGSDLPTPAIPLRRPSAVAAADAEVYAFDEPHNRILRIRLAADAEAVAPVP